MRFLFFSDLPKFPFEATLLYDLENEYIAGKVTLSNSQRNLVKVSDLNF